MKKLKYVLPIIATVMLAGCQVEENAESQQAAQTEKAMNEANKQIGMPDIVNFQERKFAKQILEMRDKEIATYTYIIDMHGKAHFICESVGYGLPYSVQFTSPQQKVYGGSGKNHLAMPQADPNGLYMPDGLSATWVLCSDKKGGVKPVYVEPQIVVSPFRMD